MGSVVVTADTTAAAEVEGVGLVEESSMASGTLSLVVVSAVVAAVASADVDGTASSSTIFFIRTIKLRFE